MARTAYEGYRDIQRSLKDLSNSLPGHIPSEQRSAEEDRVSGLRLPRLLGRVLQLSEPTVFKCSDKVAAPEIDSPESDSSPSPDSDEDDDDPQEPDSASDSSAAGFSSAHWARRGVVTCECASPGPVDADDVDDFDPARSLTQMQEWLDRLSCGADAINSEMRLVHHGIGNQISRHGEDTTDSAARKLLTANEERQQQLDGAIRDVQRHIDQEELSCFSRLEVFCKRLQALSAQARREKARRRFVRRNTGVAFPGDLEQEERYRRKRQVRLRLEADDEEANEAASESNATARARGISTPRVSTIIHSVVAQQEEIAKLQSQAEISSKQMEVHEAALELLVSNPASVADISLLTGKAPGPGAGGTTATLPQHSEGVVEVLRRASNEVLRRASRAAQKRQLLERPGYGCGVAALASPSEQAMTSHVQDSGADGQEAHAEISEEAAAVSNPLEVHEPHMAQSLLRFQGTPIVHQAAGRPPSEQEFKAAAAELERRVERAKGTFQTVEAERACFFKSVAKAEQWRNRMTIWEEEQQKSTNKASNLNEVDTNTATGTAFSIENEGKSAIASDASIAEAVSNSLEEGGAVGSSSKGVGEAVVGDAALQVVVEETRKASAASAEVMSSALDARRRRLTAQLLSLQKKAVEHGIDIKMPDESNVIQAERFKPVDLAPERKRVLKRQRRYERGKRRESGDKGMSQLIAPTQLAPASEVHRDDGGVDDVEFAGNHARIDSSQRPVVGYESPNLGVEPATASTGSADVEPPAPRRLSSKRLPSKRRHTIFNVAKANHPRMTLLLNLKQDNHHMISQIKEIEDKMRAIAASVAKGEVVGSELLGNMVASRTDEDLMYQAEIRVWKLKVCRLQQQLKKQRMSWTSPQLGDMRLATLAKAMASAAAAVQKQEGRRCSTLVTGLLKNQRAGGQCTANGSLVAESPIFEGEAVPASEQFDDSLSLPAIRKVKAAVNALFFARSSLKRGSGSQGGRRCRKLGSFGREMMPSLTSILQVPISQPSAETGNLTAFGSGRRFSSGLGVQSFSSAPAGETKALTTEADVQRPSKRKAERHRTIKAQPHEIFQEVQLQLVGRSARGHDKHHSNKHRSLRKEGSALKEAPRFSLGRPPSAPEGGILSVIGAAPHRASGVQMQTAT